MKIRQIIAIILIAALWMPVVILPSSVSADIAAQISDNSTSTASLFGLLWAKLAKLNGSAAQDVETAPAGMPPPERARRQPATPRPLLSKEDRKAKVAGLKINPENEVTLEVGQQMIMAATPLDSAGNVVHGLGAEWESNHAEVVSVTADGLATARETGKSRLTASAGNKHASLSVTVIAAQPRTHVGTEQSASINSEAPPVVRPESQASHAKRERAASAEASAPSDRSLSHARRTSKVLAALAAQAAPFFDDDRRRYVSEVGAPPGQVEPGAPTPPAAIGGTEKPGSANFSFNVPIMSLPGRGLDVSLSLVYNSRLWNKKKIGSTTTLSYDVDQNWPAPGFSLGYGKLMWSNSGYVLIDGGGTRHSLTPTNGTNMEDATEWETTDGTFTKLTTSPAVKAVFTDGMQVLYGGMSGSSRYPVKIIDRQGNFININYYGTGPRIAAITDTLNRAVTFNYEGDELVEITAPPYADGNGDRTVIRFYYRNLVVNPTGSTSFSGVSVAANSLNKSVRVISHVYFPGTHTGYAYRYSNPQSTDSYSNPYGMIYRIEQRRAMSVSTTEPLPMGSVTSEGVVAASTEYDYPTTASALSDVPKYTRRTDDWAGRNPSTPPPFYAFSVTEGTTNLSTVAAPDNTITETETYGSSHSMAGMVKQITVKLTGGAVLSRTVFSWSSDEHGNYPRLMQVLSTNDAGQTKGVVYTYDTGAIVNTNITKLSERDFTTDGTLSPVEVRRTETTYEKAMTYLNRRLAHLPTSVKVFEDGSNVASSFVEYKYDETALVPRAGLAMYIDPQSAQRGNLTKVIAYTNASAPNINAASVNQTVYDTTGNAVSMTLNCCQQKTITYSDAYMFAYPTGETKGSAPDRLSTSASYDYNTGVMIAATDENDQVTALSYYPDNMRPDTIYRPDTGYTRYHYFDGLTADPDTAHPHSYVATATASAVGTVVWSYRFMDGRGAVARSFSNHTQANGWQTTDVEYDEMGRVKRTSSPYYSTGVDAPLPTVPQMWTSVEQYDGLGRATQVRLPDSTLVQSTYEGKTTTVTDQAGRQRRQVTDALGRVVRVDEPDAAGSLGTITAPAQPTDYEYNVLGNLIRVTQAGPGGVTQQRHFRYDSLGHMTHARQVEAAATLDDNGAHLSSGGQWTGVFKYNPHGLLTDAYDARGVHTAFEYDGLNRLRHVSYSGESGVVRTPAVTYTYDQLHTGYFNRGRLTEVRTDAVSPDPATGVQAVPQTVQAYDYDLMGRIVSQQQTVGTHSY
ncbi:MAG TPA: hypothetical protein VF553_05665, partial [Pyrinomonadaceae bacterium]